MSLRARLRLRAQHGFTTVTLMGVLAVGGLLVAAGFATVDPDISLSREDQDNKQAYGSAEGGLQWYLNRLGQDNNFYVRCTNVPDPNASEAAPVNQKWSGSGADPRVWRKLPDSDAEYAVELMPAPGYTQCEENNQYSMIDSNGNMRLRITGRMGGEYRTVLATMRRRNFLDFIYFTHFETLDPAAYSNASATAWATANCSTFRSSRNSSCTEIMFADTDVVSGPFHTNDNIMVCGDAVFGRNAQDLIEISGSPAYVNGGCAASPDFLGTLDHPADQLGMPPSNAAIASVVQANYHWYGVTDITFTGGTMTVTGRRTAPTNPVTTVTGIPLPTNGVIYVHNSGSSCAGGYLRAQTYTSTPSGCGNATVRGTYGDDLTIAAENDVIIDGDLTRGSEGLLLGLIGNNFVRVRHPVDFEQNDRGGCANTGDTDGVTIEAAILALNHSFIVDNWYCGFTLGDLNMYGAIAQKFRGPVGTVSGGTIQTGYRKNYVYNDRLRYREPPYFLDPVQSAWRISRETEQVPPVK
jgi:type II secretory pathway pseudopilin PulG